MPSILYVVLEDFSTLASPVFSADATAANRRHTPYLASLAARGVVFQNAYCQAPICNPSRTSFLTGRRPTSTRVWTNDDAFPQGLPTIVDFLRDGPRTADGAAAEGEDEATAAEGDKAAAADASEVGAAGANPAPISLELGANPAPVSLELGANLAPISLELSYGQSRTRVPPLSCETGCGLRAYTKSSRWVPSEVNRPMVCRVLR